MSGDCVVVLGSSACRAASVCMPICGMCYPILGRRDFCAGLVYVRVGFRGI